MQGLVSSEGLFSTPPANRLMRELLRVVDVFTALEWYKSLTLSQSVPRRVDL